MSNSNLKSHRKAAALTVLCVICAHGGDNNARPGDYILRAKQFIRTFYPSLNGGLRVVIDDDQPLRAPGGVRIPDLLNSFHVNLFENGHAMSPLAGSCPTPVFNGYFVFDWRADEKDLVIMTADGQGADSRMVTFLREMEKDPNSSGTEITAALAAAGAQFGPDHKVEFLRSLPIEELRPYVGKIEVVSTEFRRRAAQATGASPIHF